MSDTPAGLEGATFTPPGGTPKDESSEASSGRRDYITYVPWRAWRIMSRTSRAVVRKPIRASSMLYALSGYSPVRLVAEGAAYRAWRT